MFRRLSRSVAYEAAKVEWLERRLCLSGISNLSGTVHVLGALGAAGPHPLVAFYAGDAGVQSGSAMADVNAAGVVTTTVVAYSPSPAVAGTPLTLTADIEGNASSSAGGTATFFDGADLIGVVPVSSGHAQTTYAFRAYGAHQVLVRYSGDDQHAGSIGSLLLDVNGLTPNVALTSDVNPSIEGTPITFTAIVSGSYRVPLGNVELLQGSTVIGTSGLDAAGHASFTLSLPVGHQILTAQYDGDVAYTSAASPPLDQTIDPLIPPAAAVVGRHVFYNHTAFDNNDAAPGPADDNAIASDKSALLPGQAATFANYTTYSKGINGIMIDVQGLPAADLSAADFSFKAGNSNDPSTWFAAPAPSQVLVRRGAGIGESDRVELIWPDFQVKLAPGQQPDNSAALGGKWLQIMVKTDANTGLASPDLFYFGNAPGEAGNDVANAFVNATDEIGARLDLHNFTNPAPVTNLHDYNRDKKVDATDQIIPRLNGTNFVTALKLITASSPGIPAAAESFRSLAAIMAAATENKPTHSATGGERSRLGATTTGAA